jgi:hypothetical protein
MDLLIFWVCGIYALGYCAFFVTAFPINEEMLAASGATDWTSFWLALLLTIPMSLLWPYFAIRYYVRGGSRVRTR